MSQLDIKTNKKNAYELFHQGLLALADVEMNGICIDTDYCKKQYKLLGKRMDYLAQKLKKYEIVEAWKDKYPSNFSFDSDDQLRDILFNVYGLEPLKFTDTGNPSTNQEALEGLNLDFVPDYLKWKKYNKTRNTYFKNLLRETVNGKLHAFQNLHLARTFRPSSDKPNIQNLPIRDDEIGPLIRNSVLPRKGNRLLEIDYGGIEVKGAAWYHQDPVMLEYIEGDIKGTHDMHSDMAAQCYMLDSISKSDPNEKIIRYCGKNKFVFPEFYGDYWKSCAANLWAAIDQMKLKIKEGTPLKDHLKKKGIKTYDQFAQHIKKVENDFWGRRFRVYHDWKEHYYDEYLKTGKIKLLTGFECKGVMKKNNVINYPIQGTSFHCLLWSLIKINNRLKTEGMKARIVNQIHDSIIVDLPDKEVIPFLIMANQIMCYNIKKDWPFIITPMEIEAEITPVDEPWGKKKAIEIPEAA